MNKNFNGYTNPNVISVGFFGQSGAGKTTIIRNVKQNIDGYVVAQCTGITRYLFGKNPTLYLNPDELLEKYSENLRTMNKKAVIDEIYEKYLRSQRQLLNDYSTECVETIKLYTKKTIALFDRSPIDFYAVSVGGINYLKDVLKRELNPTCKEILDSIKQIALDNTNNYFNCISVTYPWIGSSRVKLKDGVRDQYLSDFYTGDNWYNLINNFSFNNVKLFSIDNDIVDLMKRANVVDKELDTYINEELPEIWME